MTILRTLSEQEAKKEELFYDKNRLDFYYKNILGKTVLFTQGGNTPLPEELVYGNVFFATSDKTVVNETAGDFTTFSNDINNLVAQAFESTPTATNRALVYVRAGTYSAIIDLKNYVDIYCEPGVIFTDFVITDQNQGGGINSNFYGKAIINSTQDRPFDFRFNSTCNIEVESILGQQSFMFITCTTGTANITFKANEVTTLCTVSAYCMSLRNNVNFIATVTKGIYAPNSILDIRNASGKIIINTPTLNLTTGGVVNRDFKQAVLCYASTSTATVVVNGDIYDDNTFIAGSIMGTVVMSDAQGAFDGTLTINGNVYGKNNLAVYGKNSSVTGKCIIKGDIKSDFQATNLLGAGNYYFKQGGIIASTNLNLITITGTVNLYLQNLNLLNLVTNSNIIAKNSNTCNVYAYDCVTETKGATGNFCVSSLAGSLLSLHNVISNKALDANTANKIVITDAFAVDTNIIVPNF